MGPVEAGELERAVTASALYGRYAQAVDRESAYERLQPSRGGKGPDEMREARGGKGPDEIREATGAADQRARQKEQPSVVEQVVGSGMFKSLARSVGTQIGREITRSLFGTARRRR